MYTPQNSLSPKVLIRNKPPSHRIPIRSQISAPLLFITNPRPSSILNRLRRVPFRNENEALSPHLSKFKSNFHWKLKRCHLSVNISFEQQHTEALQRLKASDRNESCPRSCSFEEDWKSLGALEGHDTFNTRLQFSLP